MLHTMLDKPTNRIGNWISDSDLELAIYAELASHGFGQSCATIKNARLVAIERSGFAQVWNFEVEIEQIAQKLNLYGVARDDNPMSQPQIYLSDDIELQRSQLAKWSAGLIVRR